MIFFSFKAGYLIEDVVVNMSEVARQTLGENEMNIGDSITFQMEIDFPGLAISEKTDLVIEIFGLKPDTGKQSNTTSCPRFSFDPS